MLSPVCDRSHSQESLLPSVENLHHCLQLDPDEESRQRLRLLRGETEAQPAKSKSKAKPQYRTAQDELRDAKLRQEAEAAEEADEPGEAQVDAAEIRKADGSAESSDEDVTGAQPSSTPLLC